MKSLRFLIAAATILIGTGACVPVPLDDPTVTAGSPAAPTVVPALTVPPGPTLLPVSGNPAPNATPSLEPAGPAAFRTLAPTPTVTPPLPNPAYPLLTARIQAIQIGDDDGGRAARITPQQFKRWVDKANEVFARASIRLLYDPGLDFTAFKRTLINDMTGNGDTNWVREVEAGNLVAAAYPGKLLVLFTHGPGQQATGGGFSSSSYNFVQMPGFDDTSVCGYQNIGALAHELGHYFGLSHTFTRQFSGQASAEAYLTAYANDPKIVEGDGLTDTPPDPFINTPQFQCNPKDSITLNGRVFPLPRLNIMSYYSTTGVDRTDLTAQQSAIARWVLGVRSKNQMATPTNLDPVGVTLFASVPIKDQSGVNCSVQDMASFGDTIRWSGQRQLFCSAQPNSALGFSVSVATAGRYTVNLYATTAPDYASVQAFVDGQPLGGPIDLYAPIVLPTGKLSVGVVDLVTGTHTLGFRVVGKNAASTNYSLGLNAFRLTPGG
ncbi:MAG TPA: hypothetical protein VF478_13140 [Anaerolineae bacterium]